MHPCEGDEELSERRESDPPAGTGHGKKVRRGRKPEASARSKAGELGKALRSVYDSTLREEVPRDFTDLLGKLS